MQTDSLPPLAIDIDGTMTRPDGGVDPRLFDPLREWEAPVLVATGKAFPFPVSLCNFIGIETRVIAENGGVVLVDGDLYRDGDDSAARQVASRLEEDGYPGGWPDPDMHNIWRETELSVTRSVPYDYLVDLAREYDQTVVDTSYAYHVKSPDVSKATGLKRACEAMDRSPSEFAAIGDSPNDAELFDLVGTAYAVANADDATKERADVVTETGYGSGTLEALEAIR